MEQQLATLPWDLLLLVFEASSPSTLAILGQVSFDFLVATSKLLYGRPVTIWTLEALESLFCKANLVTDASFSRLAPYLSLVRIKDLNFDFSAFTDTLSIRLSLAFSLVPKSSATIFVDIPLNNLTLILNPSNREYLLPFLYFHFFPRLNPVSVSFGCPNRPSASTTPWSDVRSPHLDTWTRLRKISFDGILPYSYAADTSQVHLASLPSAALARLREMRLPLGTLLHHGKEFLERLEQMPVLEALEQVKDGVITLVVEREEERWGVEGKVKGLVTVGLRRKFRVVIGG